MPRSEPRIGARWKGRIQAPEARIGAVQLLSSVRLVSALLFASLAFQKVPVQMLVCIYGIAMASDLLDGLLARRLNAQSFFGRIFDIISDKSFTVVSLLYAAERGIHLFPLAVIAIREIIVTGFRPVTVNGKSLLPTSRTFGGLMAFVIWSNTLFLITRSMQQAAIATISLIYSASAAMLIVNLTVRVYLSRKRFIALISKGES